MTICIAQVLTQCGFSGCSVVVWVQPGAVSAGLQQAAADWEKQVKSCSSLCCYKRKRKKSPLQFGLNWCFETNSQIRQRLAEKFNQGVSAITHLLDRWTTNQTYLKSRSKLYIHYEWELELGNYSFFFLFIPNAERMIRTWNWEALKCRCSLAEEIKGNTVQTLHTVRLP